MIYSFIIAVSVTVFTGITIYVLVKGRKKAKLKRVSEEGYEIAYDILFPKRRTKRYRAAY